MSNFTDEFLISVAKRKCGSDFHGMLRAYGGPRTGDIRQLRGILHGLARWVRPRQIYFIRYRDPKVETPVTHDNRVIGGGRQII
jgi:hypothetical protein